MHEAQSMFADIRSACAEVAKRSRYVTLAEDELAAYARSLPLETPEPVYDTVHHFVGSPYDTLAYIITLDAVNFGSGYFPHLQKRPGMSGYFTVASALKDYFGKSGPLEARALSTLSLEDCSRLFGQDLAHPVRAELMQHFTRALNDLGDYLLAHFNGCFAALVESAEHSAERLATYLTGMPYFRDVATYEGFSVPLYKRAQITASDLALAFNGEGYGYFGDLDRLTIFADNLVPHVLCLDGVLRFNRDLARRIQRGQLLAPGSPEEVEIRAVALHAVERFVSVLRSDQEGVTAQNLDVRLWNRGQDSRYKAQPRHRTRTVFY